jgi:hypothetical protein
MGYAIAEVKDSQVRFLTPSEGPRALVFDQVNGARTILSGLETGSTEYVLHSLQEQDPGEALQHKMDLIIISDAHTVFPPQWRSQESAYNAPDHTYVTAVVDRFTGGYDHYLQQFKSGGFALMTIRPWSISTNS